MNRRVKIWLFPISLIGILFAFSLLFPGTFFDVFPAMIMIILIAGIGYYLATRLRKKNDKVLDDRLERLDDYEGNGI